MTSFVNSSVKRPWAASNAARSSGDGGSPGVNRGMFAGMGRLPLGITTIIGTDLFAAMRLSSMKPARPTVVHPASSSPPPCNR